MSASLTNDKANDKTLTNKKYFKQRSISINKIKISLIPKIDYDIFKNEVITLDYDPTRTGILLSEINKSVNNQLLNLINKNNINSNIFFYLFDSINLLQEDISNLSSVSSNLEYEINVSCTKSYVISNDSFLKNMITTILKIRFIQKFNINNLGLKTKIFTSNLTLVNETYIINQFNVHSFLFDSILKLEKINETQWFIFVSEKYQTNIFGSMTINLFLIIQVTEWK